MFRRKGRGSLWNGDWIWNFVGDYIDHIISMACVSLFSSKPF